MLIATRIAREVQTLLKPEAEDQQRLRSITRQKIHQEATRNIVIREITNIKNASDWNTEMSMVYVSRYQSRDSLSIDNPRQYFLAT